MKDLLEILKYTLPSLIGFGVIYLIIRSFHENEKGRDGFEHKAEMLKLLTPLRLQAYERMILFLERMAPPNLLLRVGEGEESVRQYHASLIRTIREEYEYNLSQQLYISTEAWLKIKSAKDDLLRQINLAAANLDPQSSSSALFGAVLGMSMDQDLRLLDDAVAFLKAEVQAWF